MTPSIETLATGTVAGELIEAMRVGDRVRIIPAIRKMIELFAGLADKVDIEGITEFLQSDSLAKLWDTLRLVLSLFGVDLPVLPLAGAATLDVSVADELDGMCDEAAQGVVVAQSISLPAIIALVKLIIQLISRFRGQ